MPLVKKLQNYLFSEPKYLTVKLWPKLVTSTGKAALLATPRGSTSWPLQITAGLIALSVQSQRLFTVQPPVSNWSCHSPAWTAQVVQANIDWSLWSVWLQVQILVELYTNKTFFYSFLLIFQKILIWRTLSESTQANLSFCCNVCLYILCNQIYFTLNFAIMWTV